MIKDEELRIRAYCDQLYLRYRQLQAEPNVARLQAVVEISHQIEAMAFSVVLIKKHRAIQITNNRFEWVNAGEAVHDQPPASLSPQQEKSNCPTT